MQDSGQEAPTRYTVSSFDLVEPIVARGIGSERVAVAADESEVRWDKDEVYVPARPHPAPWPSLVILPTYDEAENVRNMVQAIQLYLDADILIVDDNSPDGTGRIADELCAERPRVHVLHRSEKTGLGGAYRAGFQWAFDRGYERILASDCDFSHAPWDLPRLLHASAHADLVIGSRYVPGGSTEGWSWRRRLLSRGGNLYASIFLGRRVRDWTAGFRCFRTDFLKRLDLSSVQANGYSFQIAMAWAVLRAGGTVREIPVRFVDRTSGESKMSWSIAFEAIRLIPTLRMRTPRP